MKYLITVCFTAIAIAFLFSSAWSFNTMLREESRFRIASFKEYARQRHIYKVDPHDVGKLPAEPRVDAPTAKRPSGSDDLQKEKL